MTKVLIHGRDNRIGGADPIPPGEWVYVGDFPDDPNTTENSPPFQNGWTNAGGDERRLRFRRTNENQTEIAGSVVGGTAPSVVTTLPELYRVTENEYAASGLPGGGVAVWQLATNGELSMMTAINFPGSGTDPLDALHWGTNVDANDDGLGILALDTDMQLVALNLLAQATEVLELLAPNTGIRIEPLLIDNQLDTSAVFKISDHLGNPILQITEGSDDIHIRAGANIVADL